MRQVNWVDLGDLNTNGTDEDGRPIDIVDVITADFNLGNESHVFLYRLEEYSWFSDLIDEVEADADYNPDLDTYLEISW